MGKDQVVNFLRTDVPSSHYTIIQRTMLSCNPAFQVLMLVLEQNELLPL